MRYLALILLIVMGMYIVVSVVGAAETIITGSAEKAEENAVEDGEFCVLLPLTAQQERELEACGITLERLFYMDMDAADGSVLRLMKNRESINRIDIDSGRLAVKNGEIVLEKRYCEEHGLSVNDNIRIGDTEFVIVGIGSTPDYDMPIKELSDMAVESSLFGTAFVTSDQYEELRGAGHGKAETYCYAYRLNNALTDEEVRERMKAFSADYLISFVKAADNPRILGAAGDMQMNKQIGLAAGVIVMLLFTYVISVFVVHQIHQESSVIGTLYALGGRKKDFIRHYTTLPALITLAGGLAGAALGFSPLGIPVQMSDTYHYYSVPKLDAVYPVYLIVYSIFMPPLVSVLVNGIVMNKRLSGTALSLIKNEQKAGDCRNFNLGKMGFVRRFQLRQMLREMRTALTVVFGMIIALVIFMLGMDCYMLCRNVKRDSNASVKFEYMYTLTYPAEEVPQGGEACYVKSLSKERMGYTLDISVIGIDGDNKYYGVQPAEGGSSIIIGKSVQEKYGLQTGDLLTLTDKADDSEYVFTVEGISDYANGLAVFMDIDSMRELFGQKNGYYNMLLSDEALDIEEARLYAVTTRSDVERASSVFIDLMKPLIILMIAVSIIIFCAVLYLMTGVMIDRASFGIALIQIFGFRTGEIKRLYLNGNAWIIAVGAAIGIPISKRIMDTLYPWMIANTACGMNLKFPWYLYIIIFAGVMGIYFIVNALLVKKLKRITPAQVLKNRE